MYERAGKGGGAGGGGVEGREEKGRYENGWGPSETRTHSTGPERGAHGIGNGLCGFNIGDADILALGVFAGGGGKEGGGWWTVA